MNIEKILIIANNFRYAIENCSPSLGISFEYFPKGSCGDVAPLLGTYLIENKLGKFQYMLGDWGI